MANLQIARRILNCNFCQKIDVSRETLEARGASFEISQQAELNRRFRRLRESRLAARRHKGRKKSEIPGSVILIWTGDLFRVFHLRQSAKSAVHPRPSRNFKMCERGTMVDRPSLARRASARRGRLGSGEDFVEPYGHRSVIGLFPQFSRRDMVEQHDTAGGEFVLTHGF